MVLRMREPKPSKLDTATEINRDLLSFFDSSKQNAESIQAATKSYKHRQRLVALDQLETEFEAELNLHRNYEKQYALNHEEKQKAFANACMLYFTALILKEHYKDYRLEKKYKRYRDTVEKLECDLFYLREDTANKQETHLQLLALVKNAAKKAVSASMYRDAATYINLQRIYWIFCKLTMVELDVIFGSSTAFPHADKLAEIISLPSATNNILSVAIFSLRLVHDIAMIVKHTFGNRAERENSSAGQRFVFELKKRFLDMLNNIVWGVINFVTNYGNICHISDVTGGYIISALLVFDIALVSFKRIEARKKYETAKAVLNAKIISAKDGKQRDVFFAQLKELEKDWAVKSKVFNFNQLAAGFIFAGWTVSLFVPPAAMLVGFITVTLGVAMYMSSDLYAAYVKAKKKLETRGAPLTSYLPLKIRSTIQS